MHYIDCAGFTYVFKTHTICVCVYVCVWQQVMKKEIIDLKESKKGYVGRSEDNKRKGENM